MLKIPHKKKQIKNKDEESEVMTIDNKIVSIEKSNEGENVNLMFQKSDRSEPVLKLHKIKEITYDSEKFSYICQHLEILPVIFKCKNENCKAYKIIQNFDYQQEFLLEIGQVKSYFEEHDCIEDTQIVSVSCMNYLAIMDIKKFKSGGIGNCIQLGHSPYIE